MTPLHHLHAAASQTTGARAAVSFDIGPDMRVRLDAGDASAKPEAIRRLVLLWNMHEGIPTDVLEAGAIRQVFDAFGELLAQLEADHGHSVLFSSRVLQHAKAAVKAWEAVQVDHTPDGHRAACDCSEHNAEGLVVAALAAKLLLERGAA